MLACPPYPQKENEIMKRLISLVVLLSVTVLTASTQVAPAQTGAAGDPRVKAALDKLGWKYEIDKDGDFKVGIKFQDGRTQLAWITSSTETLGNLEIRQVMSPGYRTDGALSAQIANQLLIDNTHKKLGAWQTFSTEKASLAVFSAKIPADSNPETLQSSLQAVLHSADAMEKTLTGKDVF
jgi:hypothetical protein